MCSPGSGLSWATPLLEPHFPLVFSLLTLTEDLLDAAAGPHSGKDRVQGCGSRQEKQQEHDHCVSWGFFDKLSHTERLKTARTKHLTVQRSEVSTVAAGVCRAGSLWGRIPILAFASLHLPAHGAFLQLQSHSTASSRLCPPLSLLMPSYKDLRDYQDSFPSSGSFSHLPSPFGHGR